MYNDIAWQTYQSGVLTNSSTIDKTAGHCVLLVGIKSDGTTNKLTNYWKFKNSWGTGWG